MAEALELRCDGPEDGQVVVLAHGAGAPMESDFMEAFAGGLAGHGYRVARFEFPYMARRRREGTKRPPDREPVLLDSWRNVVEQLGGGGLVVGGKSLGGRMASMVADEVGAKALVCLGYPFHAPGRPRSPRIAQLEHIRTPTLILQGTRDPFGKPDEVRGYPLGTNVRVHWLEDGDHDLKPRKSSGRTVEQNWDEGVEAVATFLGGLR